MKLFEVPKNANVITKNETNKTVKEKLASFSKSLDLSTYSTVKSNTNIQSCNSEITTSDLVNNKDELSLSVNKNIEHKLCNVVCQKIKKTEKQILNEIHELNVTSPYKSENQTNSSCIDVESCKHKNINHQISNLSSDLSLFSKNTNENVFHCNNSDVGIQNMSFDPDDTQNRSSDEVEETITSNDQADVQNIFNNEREETIMSNDQDVVQNIFSDEETIMSNYQNCMNDSSPDKPLLQLESVGSLEPSSSQLNQTYLKIPHYIVKNACPINKDNIDANKTASDNDFSPDSCESQYRIREFPRLPKVNTHSSQQNKKDEYHEISFEINHANQHIFDDLLDQFGDPSAVISYLMENERLLFSGKLVISDITNPDAANYIINHLDVLKKWYGDPEDNDLSESFISASYPKARIYSQRLPLSVPNLQKSNETSQPSSSIQLPTAVRSKEKSKPDESSIDTCSLLSSQNLHSSLSASENNYIPEIQEVTSPTYSSCMPLESNQTVNVLPAPEQFQPSTNICFAPNFKKL